MTFKVTQSTNNFSVKLKASSKFKVSVQGGSGSVAQSFEDLVDFNGAGVQDKYVIMYDASTGKYIPVNPDIVLNAAAGTETIQPGLVGYAQTFIDRMDIDLDDKIDLDAGGF